MTGPPEAEGGAARLPQAEPAGARVPDFFIVGHHKSGTTALYEMLRRHPQIFMPALKEPRFLAADLRALVSSTPQQPDTLEEYLALFEPARADQLAGEASPGYLRSRTAAQAIHNLQPDARIIAILREPASFVRSMHLQMVQEHVEQERDLRKAFEHEQLERSGQTVKRYSDHIHYVEQLRRYHAVFAPEQILVLIYDDFRRDNESIVRQVLRFLGVDDTLPVETVEANPSVHVRSIRLDGVLRRLAGRGPPRAIVKALLPEGVGRRLRRGLVYGRPEAVDAELERELRDRFRGEVAALSEYLGRDLVSLWGYR